MKQSFLSFLRGLKQELRSHELAWLFVALTLSVTALSSVSFLADRMQRAFQFDARQLLASDVLISSDQPLPERFMVEARNNGLQVAQTIVFPSMATVGTHSKLASLKAVSPLYPLRGTLQVQSNNSLRAALLAWSKTLAAEVANEGITVNVIMPGRVATDRLRQLDEARAKRENTSYAEVVKASLRQIPMGRYGDPKEYGDAAAFLASQNASFITGTVMRVDGGQIQAI